jgi:hypothetical protein
MYTADKEKGRKKKKKKKNDEEKEKEISAGADERAPPRSISLYYFRSFSPEISSLSNRTLCVIAPHTRADEQDAQYQREREPSYYRMITL